VCVYLCMCVCELYIYMHIFMTKSAMRRMQNASDENKRNIFQHFKHVLITINSTKNRLLRPGKWMIILYFERKTRIIYISHIIAHVAPTNLI